MRFSIGSSSSSAASSATAFSADSALPPDHPPVASSSRRPPPSCPMHQSTPPPAPSKAIAGGAKCPIDHASLPPGAKPGKGGLNPLNHIPLGLSADQRAPNQVLDLPTDRTSSTIPRPKTSGAQEEGEKVGDVWEYPSPQQFYNALVRKGWETPEDSIEMVVAIHNFLNEKAWEEVMKWEKRLPGGEQAQLARFQGKPGELSPKARMHLWAGWMFPSKFNTEPPFDRHDWIVTRPNIPSSAQTMTSTISSETPNSKSQSTTTTTTSPEGVSTTTTRYVIDYYSAPPDEDGNPCFNLDVRPALDSFESISQRVRVGLEEWMKGEQKSS